MIKEKLLEEIKVAMKSGQKDRLGTLRMLHSGIKDFEINNRKPAEESDVIGIFRKAIKTRKDSVESFRSGGREDLAAKEESEIAVIESFLPAGISDDELRAIVDAAITEAGATSMKEVGAVMKIALGKTGGRADGSAVNTIVKERLAGK